MNERQREKEKEILSEEILQELPNVKKRGNGDEIKTLTIKPELSCDYISYSCV